MVLLVSRNRNGTSSSSVALPEAARNSRASGETRFSASYGEDVLQPASREVVGAAPVGEKMAPSARLLDRRARANLRPRRWSRCPRSRRCRARPRTPPRESTACPPWRARPPRRARRLQRPLHARFSAACAQPAKAPPMAARSSPPRAAMPRNRFAQRRVVEQKRVARARLTAAQRAAVARHPRPSRLRSAALDAQHALVHRCRHYSGPPRILTGKGADRGRRPVVAVDLRATE